MAEPKPVQQNNTHGHKLRNIKTEYNNIGKEELNYLQYSCSQNTNEHVWDKLDHQLHAMLFLLDVSPKSLSLMTE